MSKTQSRLDQTFNTMEEESPDRNVNVSAPHNPMNIATISSGFEKGDFLVREEKGQRVYFDFFEEAFNYLANKGYARMNEDEAGDWMEAVNAAHSSIPNGTRYNTGVLLMVLTKPVDLSLMYSGSGSSDEKIEGEELESGLV